MCRLPSMAMKSLTIAKGYPEAIDSPWDNVRTAMCRLPSMTKEGLKIANG